jgi:hypothetical protein
MIDSSVSQGVTALQLLASIDAAATANATTATGIDIQDYDGYLIVTQNVGVVDAGSITGTIITSAASNLSSPTTVGTFVAVTTANDPNVQSISIPLNKCQQYIGYIGTIVTGGALVSCTAIGKKKTV